MTETSSPQSTPIAYAPSNNEQQIKQLNQYFMFWWICLAAGAVLMIIFIGILGLIASIVFYMLLLHKLWTLVQPSEKSTPGKAIGFLFIPFFNLYWQFVAIYGLAQEVNRKRTQMGIGGTPVNEQMAMIGCICNCCSIIPFLGIVAAIAGFVIQIIVLKDIKNAGIDILRATPAVAA